MRGQWQIGSFFGIPFYLDTSWFIIVGLVSLANATEINQQILGNNQIWLGGHWYRLARSYKRCNTRGSTNQANLE